MCAPAGGTRVTLIRDGVGSATVPDSASHVFVRYLDLSNFSSVKKFATEVMKEWATVDVLIYNAGIVGQKTHETTVDGNEVSFQTNHLSHILLTNLLLPAIQRSTVSRASYLSFLITRPPAVSTTHHSFPLPPPPLSHITTTTVCPGFVITGLGVAQDAAGIASMREKEGATPGHDGVYSSVFAACSVEAGFAAGGGGEVEEKKGEGKGKGEWRTYDTYAVRQELHPVAADEEVGRRLWEESRRLCGKYGEEVRL
ncbi:hypothetical protein M427DRAFT_36267 [Gonapodya prolifera JEL478]|uniref:NAD(P)-binding protein n=1 Tax=Gonapodya prolifera (strain JEL478) TaxID=1344416 RepID=A0A139A3X8_GONPJ|nr:hypothetical protein M427DRAFT_36267 [Gonapodya prolifera JEL478]|eukprot:KXS11073.1 hypothetical protein M427DRAFT_36267 [Gonapodya prolifera JEL478]